MIKETIEKNSQAKVNSREMELLKKDFPQCFDKDGKFDLKAFEDLIRTEEVDIKKEGYSLDFLGKSYARYLASLDSETVIVPDEENKSIDSQNVYIVGDNLDALQHLKYSYSGQIKCIYIDPPYNTGSDGFVYNDKFEFTAEELARKINIEEDEAQRVLDMQGKSTHSAWLTFMYPRLELAKDLLTEDGVIFISIDNNEQANCKLICDLIFGEGNYIGDLPRITKKSGKDHSNGVANNHDYVLVYCRNKDLASINGLDANIEDYTEKDEWFDERGPYKLNQTLDYDSLWYNPSMDFEIAIGDNSFYPGGSKELHDQRHAGKHNAKDWVWRWSKALFEFGYENGFIVIKEGKNRPRIYTKTYYGVKIAKAANGYTIKKINRDKKLSSIALTDNQYSNDNATKEIAELIDKNLFDFPKPTTLIKELIGLVTDEAIVMDFFSGSGTTADSVMQLNVKEQCNLQYVMVQLNEPCKSNVHGYKTIDEIGRKRIRRAAKKLVKDHPEKAKGVDLGFKTYYLKATDKTTLDKITEFNPMLPIDGEDIKSKFGVDTVLETWKIRDGYGFNAAVQTVDLQGYTAYLLSDNNVGTNLYLIDDMPEKSIIELVRKIEAHELNLDRIIEYGYAFSYTTNTVLRSNLKTLKNRTSIEPIIRY